MNYLIVLLSIVHANFGELHSNGILFSINIGLTI